MIDRLVVTPKGVGGLSVSHRRQQLSNLLTEPAPDGEEDAAPVGEPGIAQPNEVGDGSSPVIPEGFVPEERFNGLMSSFNKAQAEAQARAEEVSTLTERLAAIEAKVLDEPKPEESLEVSNPELEQMQNQLAALTELITSQATSSAEREMEAVWDEFEEAKPFKDLFVASNAEDLREVVSTFSERLKGFTASGGEPAAEEQAGNTAPAVEAPSGGGGVGVVTDSPTAPVQLQEAIAKRDVAAYLKAKAQATYGDESGLTLSPTN